MVVKRNTCMLEIISIKYFPPEFVQHIDTRDKSYAYYIHTVELVSIVFNCGADVLVEFLNTKYCTQLKTRIDKMAYTCIFKHTIADKQCMII